MDVSSADDRFLHPVLMQSAREVWGIDADKVGLDAMREQGVPNLLEGNLEALECLPLEKTFDVIVAGEVIEHLSNPGLFLAGVQRFMRKDTDLVVTTVNAFCGFRAAVYAIRGKGGISEPVHPDHVAYYSYSTLGHIGRRAGLRMREFAFYDLGNEHRPVTRRSISLINDVLVTFAPQLADGVIGIFQLDGERA